MFYVTSLPIGYFVQTEIIDQLQTDMKTMNEKIESMSKDLFENKVNNNYIPFSGQFEHFDFQRKHFINESQHFIVSWGKMGIRSTMGEI